MAITDLTNFKKSPILNKLKSMFSSRQPQAYHGGNYGSSSGGAKFPYGLSTSNPVLNLDHYRLRQQARVAMQDSPEGRAIVERKVDAIAYTGLKLEPTPDAGILGITQEQAAAWSKDIAARHDLWASDKKQHRSETLTFYQAQWLYTYFKERDNDVFVRLYYSPEKALQNPLQFEFIDPDQIRGQEITTSYGFQYGSDGIVRDGRNRETGYKIWIKKINENGSFYYEPVEIQRKGPKSGRVFMLHGFSAEYAGQGRGFTKLSPIIQELENLTDFKLAHIKMAINQAIMNAWVVPSDDEDAQNIFDNQLTNSGAGAFVPDAEPTAVATEDCISDFECHRIPEATFDNPSMFIQNLTKGADIKFGNPNSPVASYDKFTDSFLLNLSAVAGVPREVVQMKFGNNYSASRATLLLFQRIVEIQRDDAGADLNNPIKEMWLAGEIASGRVSAPGWSDPRLRAAWLKCAWRGAPVPDIDPKKLADSRRLNIEMGLAAAETESQTHSGKSAADNISQNNLTYQEYEPLPWSEAAIAEEMNENEDEED